MIKKITKGIRDILLFLSLLGLINIASKRTYHFISAHEKSVIHELDQDFLNQLYIAKKQAYMAQKLMMQCTEHDYVCNLNMQKLQQKIDALEAEYKKNSPGLALLGPIGTTSIIFKEKRVSKKLLSVVNELTEALVPHIAKTAAEKAIFTPAATITQALETNKQLIDTLQTIYS